MKFVFQREDFFFEFNNSISCTSADSHRMSLLKFHDKFFFNFSQSFVSFLRDNSEYSLPHIDSTRQTRTAGQCTIVSNYTLRLVRVKVKLMENSFQNLLERAVYVRPQHITSILILNILRSQALTSRFTFTILCATQTSLTHQEIKTLSSEKFPLYSLFSFSHFDSYSYDKCSWEEIKHAWISFKYTVEKEHLLSFLQIENSLKRFSFFFVRF